MGGLREFYDILRQASQNKKQAVTVYTVGGHKFYGLVAEVKGDGSVDCVKVDVANDGLEHHRPPTFVTIDGANIEAVEVFGHL